MGRVLWPGGVHVMEFMDFIGHVAGHLYVHKACFVITFEDDAAVEAACTVLVDLIFSFELCDEVVSILLLIVFYAKVINN